MFETVTLITDGTGFVGQKLVQNLDHSGIGIRLISRKAHSHYESVICDLKDAHVPDYAMHGVDTVDPDKKTDWLAKDGRWWLGLYSNSTDMVSKRATGKKVNI